MITISFAMPLMYYFSLPPIQVLYVSSYMCHVIIKVFIVAEKLGKSWCPSWQPLLRQADSH